MVNEESRLDVVKEARAWNKDVPQNGDFYVAGWYFQRRLSNHARQIVEINSHGHIWRIGAPNTKLVIDLRATGDYEWLGPVSPELVSALCDEVEQLKSLNHTQAESIVECQREQKELRRALVEVLIPYEALLADAGSRKWIAPEVWGSVEQAVKAARSVVTPKGSEQ